MSVWVAPLSLGVLSGLGSCALARAAVLTTFAGVGAGSRMLWSIGAYTAGTAFGYAAYGIFAHWAVRSAGLSSFTYVVLAVLLAIGGAVTLLRGDHSHRTCSTQSFGGALLLGFGGSIALSPCCTPFVFALVAQGGDDAGRAASLLAIFAVGHVVPAIALAILLGSGRLITAHLRRWITFASGVTSLAMAGYYGIIA